MCVNHCFRVAPKCWLKKSFLEYFFFISCIFSFFLFLTEKDVKTPKKTPVEENRDKKHQFYPLKATKYTTKTKLVNNFDQQMMCESPVLWSKYMTKNKAGKAVCDKRIF